MKKALCMLFVMFCAISSVGCKGTVEKHFDKISELRTVVYEGGDEALRITAISGLKEEPFDIDGFSGEKKEFTLITMVPSHFDEKVEYSYETQISDKNFSGSFAIHPFEDSYSAMIPLGTSTDSFVVVISDGKGSSEYLLSKPANENFIDADKALEIALKRLSTCIKRLDEEDLSYEIYVRLTENPISNAKGYFWYVAFVAQNGTTYAVLIDPQSMEIVAIRD